MKLEKRYFWFMYELPLKPSLQSTLNRQQDVQLVPHGDIHTATEKRLTREANNVTPGHALSMIIPTHGHPGSPGGVVLPVHSALAA